MTPNQTDQVTIESGAGSQDGVRILQIAGPLTIRNFFEFQELSRKETSPVLIIDLAAVPYMDSAALGSLLGIHVSCEKNGRKYALIGVNDRLQKLFTVCGVRNVLVIYPNLEEAETALAEPRAASV